MKNKKSFLFVLTTILLLASCGSNNSSTNSSMNDSSLSNNSDSNPVEEPKTDRDVLFDENYENLIPLDEVNAVSYDELMYDYDLFGYFDEGKYQELYLNNVRNDDLKDGQVKDTDDPRYLYYSDDKVRYVNRAEGYAINLKSDTTMNVDFSVGQYRSKLYNKESTLLITHETQNPYDNWATYRDEWLIRYINNPEYLNDNNLEYTEDVIFENGQILDNHLVSIFSIKINDAGAIKKMYYNIGIVRNILDPKGKDFYLFVMKSNNNRTDDFKEMIKSFEIIESKGTPSNQIYNLPVKEEEKWDEQTKKYYNQLLTQERTGWGMFTACIEDNQIVKSKVGKLSEAMDYNYDILPTYLHTSYNNSVDLFEYKKAIELAGGNGENGKMVLQLSYQFTNNNNTVLGDDLYTPMFDILRGPVADVEQFMTMRYKLNKAFKSLADGLKAYKEPVLFRLNNEMNTDWTSYCGMMSLIDPDIFQATWRYLYNYLLEEGVTNTIWIFNPIAETCPFSNWGEDMCYYPGLDYVQSLGLTYYEDNNNGLCNDKTFRNDYTKLYEKNNPVWKNYPWIISEFGCGAGGEVNAYGTPGERYRNALSQAAYVEGMFADFAERSKHPYLQNIKGAVWFSVNDYASGKVLNQYELVVEQLPDTMLAFKNGLKINK